MSTVRVDLCFFAALRERLGDRTSLEVARGTTLGALWRDVASAVPGLGRLPVRFAIRERYVEPSHVLRQDVEVDVFPPVSGGC